MYCTFKTVFFVLLQGWGLTVTLGVPKMDPEVRAHYGLLLSGRTLKGTLFGGWKPKSELPKLMDMYIRKVRTKLQIFETYFFPQSYIFFLIDIPFVF